MTGSDLDLLAALFEDPFASYAQLGDHLGMTGQGARKRVLRLREEGVLQGFVATPVPAVFDRVGRFATFEVSDPDIEAALELEDVVLVGATIDGLSTLVGFLPPDGEADRQAAWRQALEADAPVYEGAYRADVDPGPLGPLDWRVVDALLDDPRASLTDLAEATGLTRRTVRDRRTRLVDEGAVEVTPLLGSSESGRLFFHLGVLGFDGPPLQLTRELPGAVLAERVGPVADVGGGAILFCEADSLADQHQLVERARGLDGVTDVRPYLLEGYRVHTERLSAWVEDELDTWDRARRQRSDT